MKKEEFVTFIDSIINTYSKDRLINAFLILANEASEEEQRKIELALFGKTSLDSINDLKKVYNESEIAFLKDEIEEVISSFKKIKKEELTIDKEVNYEYDDWYNNGNEFFYYDTYSIMDIVGKGATLLKKGIKFGLSVELLDLVKEFMHFSINAICKEYDEIENMDLRHFINQFSVNSLFDEIANNIYYVLLVSLFPKESATEIIEFINEQDLSFKSLKDFLYENSYKVNNLDEFIITFSEVLVNCYKDEPSYILKSEIKDIFEIFDLMTDKIRFKEILFELSSNQILYLIYLIKYFKYEERYFYKGLSLLEISEEDEEAKALISNLLFPHLKEINDDETKYKFVKLSFFVNPNIETYKNFMLFEKEETKGLIYDFVNLKIKPTDSDSNSSDNNDPLNYIFLLLLNKNEEFFNYFINLKSYYSMKKDLLEIIVSKIVKEKTNYPVIEALKTIPFTQVICRSKIGSLSCFENQIDKFDLMTFIQKNISFSSEEITRIYKTIFNCTKKFVENITEFKDRHSYGEGAFLIHLVDELNSYINHGVRGSVINKYLNEYRIFRSLVREIRSIEYNSTSNLINKLDE